MSPTSVCYTVTKIESGSDDLGGSGITTRAGLASAGMKAGSGIQFGIRKQEKVSSVSPLLKVNKDSHRIRKPPLPLPQVQYRPPIIIHTYSPKVIHTQPDDFMSLVQKLTGSSDTRLRLKRKPSSKKAASVTASGGGSDLSDKVDVQTDPEQQGSKTSAQCGSPSSSEEDSSFLANSEVCTGDGLATNSKQSHSPRSPLSNFEFDSQVDFPFTPFDPSSGLFSHVKAEPSFSFNDNSFNFFTDFNTQPPKQAGSMKQPAPKTQMLHQEYSPFHSSIDINSPLLSSGLMAGLPDLSPASASWSQSFLDSYLTGTPSSFTNQPPIQRQRFSGPGYTSSSEGTMVALENIQAFMLT
ncbi:hypothetical protein KC19_5G081400 [Ceratodon purpureus]|uniref:VQ domain-containing protein n=1 Tax=Ceratodon purpureus TaxID=3225 RepID=A0A8T0I0L8_CERPU|nr:hypothetical protein KC19_5G081400 [Ceratodon purpureus]